MPRVALEFLVSTASSTGALVEPSSTDTPGRRQYLLSDDYIRDFFSFLSGRLPPEDSPFWQTGRLPRASHQSDGTHSDAAFNEQEPSSVGDSEGSGSATCVESLRGTEGDASDAAGESSVKEDVMTLMWDWVTTEDSDAIGSPWEREVGRATGFSLCRRLSQSSSFEFDNLETASEVLPDQSTIGGGMDGGSSCVSDEEGLGDHRSSS
jgi:hypothetical protein